MHQLIKLISTTLENKSIENYSSSGPWSIGFCERSFGIVFDIYFNKIPVLSGNSKNKTIKLCTSEHIYPYDKLIEAVSVGLPEYTLTGEIYDRHISRNNLSLAFQPLVLINV